MAIQKQIDGSQKIGKLAREGVTLMKRAREIQSEIKESGEGGDLLDAYTWGFIEQARKKGDRPIFDVFEDMFKEIERGSVELNAELEKTKERIDG